jgi:ribose-phosphate pyrophosphokinase
VKGESTVLTVPASQQEVESVTQELAAPGKVKPERKRAGRLSEDKRFKIFAGSANRKLAEGICAHVGVQLGESKL